MAEAELVLDFNQIHYKYNICVAYTFFLLGFLGEYRRAKADIHQNRSITKVLGELRPTYEKGTQLS